MYVILVYDVSVERVNKVLAIGRKYLTWIQNSVLEGEISRGNLTRLEDEIKQVVDEEHDSITFYILRTTRYLEKRTIGRVKGEIAKIL